VVQSLPDFETTSRTQSLRVLSLASPASLVPGHVRRCLTSVWNGVTTASVLDFVRFRPVATVGQVKATDIRTREGSDLQADLRL